MPENVAYNHADITVEQVSESGWLCTINIKRFS